MDLRSKPVVVYDGDCGFCRRWVERWRARTGDHVDFRPFQEPGVLETYDIPLEAARRAVQLVTPRATPPTTAFVRSLFQRALGGVYVIAFTSLREQVLGLYGERGILPVRDYLDAIRTLSRDRPSRRMRLAPSVLWLDASDRALVRACAAGQVCGALLALGIAPRTTALAGWALYLSFVSVGRDFLSFQWDALLVETGLAAAITASPRSDENPPGLATLLMRTLAFRLYFESGLCKVASRDPTWRSFTASNYHFETQPLPTRAGWYAHHVPSSVHRLATAMVLALELVAPWLAFAPRRLRRAAFVALGSLQALIEITGNYGFFNLLTVVDSLWMLDDESLARAFRIRRRARRAPWWRRLATAAAVLPILALAIGELVGRIRRRPVRARAVAWLDDKLAPFHPVSSYGLFSVMTTERPEIVIEGSMDGVEWREYRFRYKPGDVHAPPRTVAPHQPRLDWQMWFAAMQPPPPWFANLLVRLLEGSPDVLALLADDPFAGTRPAYVRALLYDYRMTDLATRQRTGAWWTRELRGLYFPPVRAASSPR